MTQRQENLTAMFEATLQFVDENNSLWSGIPAFAAAVTDARNGVQAIRDASNIQEAPVGVVIAQKTKPGMTSKIRQSRWQTDSQHWRRRPATSAWLSKWR